MLLAKGFLDGASSDYQINNTGPWVPFQRTRNYQLPEALFEQLNQAQLATEMGLFAEINHAWATIDNALYLWDYTVPNPSLIGYEDQPHEITSVHLAVPRRGVFLPSITHVIVLATRADVILLGLGKEAVPTGRKELQLFDTGMSISVRGLSIKVIASSPKTGRIFFAGETENHVYELQYQNEERWFLGRCGKKNHTYGWSASFAPSFGFRQRPAQYVKQMLVDDTRDLVYTLSNESAIRAFHMDSDQTLKETLHYSSRALYSIIGHYVAENEAFNSNHRIVSISSISEEESSKFHLVAVTQNGYRIYITAVGPGSWGLGNSSKAPTSLAVPLVRFPPNQSPDASKSVQLSLQVQRIGQGPQSSKLPTRAATRFAPGYFICLESNAQRIFLAAPDPGLVPRKSGENQPHPSRENAMWANLDGPAESVDISRPYQPPISTPKGFGNELAVQFDKAAVELAVLTNTGVYIFRRRSLVDNFAALYREGGGDEGREGAIRKLMSNYGRGETLATALAVACGQGTEFTPDSGVGQIRDPDVLAFARSIFIEQGGKPKIDENVQQSVSALDTVIPSPRHEAMAIYISRILRSTWNALIARELRTPTGGYSVVSTVAVEKLRGVQQNLSTLSQFFTKNSSSIEGLRGPDDNRPAATRQDELKLQGENRALHSLVQLVEKAIEGIAFLLMLFEERVEDLVRLLAEPTRPIFFQLTYQSLFTDETGLRVAKELVKAIVNRNIARGSNVETVAETLRRRCGQFCSPDDVVTFRAQELLKRATEAGPDSEYGRNLLNESLILFTQITKSLQWEYLESAVKQYTALKFFAGAIQLALKVANDSDPTDEAGSLLLDDMPLDQKRQNFFDYRQRCYNLTHDVVNAVDQSVNQDISSARARASTIAQRQREAYDVIAESTDELFLSNLYDWYLAQGWTERLLATDSNYIVPYLERKARDDYTHADLLWRYHALKQRYIESSQIQLELANSGFRLSLSKRIFYLSQAKTNIQLNRRARDKDRRQRLLKEISDYLDIGNLQDDLLQRFKSDERFDDDNRNRVLDDLDGQIKTITEVRSPSSPFLLFATNSNQSYTTATSKKLLITTWPL